jgi:tetraacyldisaccharide 4'-kinase
MRIVSGDAGGIGPSSARAALSVLSGFYLAGLKARQAAYGAGLMRRQKVNAWVLSIGNITAGGTGKTPAAIYYARKFLGEGRSVVVLSRGYGRAAPAAGPLAVSDREKVLLSPRECGDEPYLIARKVPGVPVVVCAKRVKGAELAMERFGAEVIVLDDAFQHVAIARDEDIVVIDCANPFGFGRVLPRGLLREPLSALGRATRFLLTRADECEHEHIIEKLKELNPAAEILRSRHRPVGLTALSGEGEEACDWVSGKKVLAVSGIGNPKAFEDTLKRLGARLVHALRFEDHRWYDAADIAAIESAAKRFGAEHIVSTEKDGVRLALTPKAPKDTLLLEIELELMD